MILGTTTNNGDDLKAVTFLNRLVPPAFGGEDQTVEFNDNQPGVMAKGVNYLIQMGEASVDLTCFSIDGELHVESTV